MTITLSIPESLKPEDGRFGSGPSKIRPEQIAALDAGATTLLGTSHRQAPVKQLVASIREGLREFFHLPEGYEVALGNGGASAFWEIACASLITRRAAFGTYGSFSAKFAASAANAPFLEDPVLFPGEPGTYRLPELTEGVDTYCWAHNETSTGVAAPIRRVAGSREAGALTVIDGTSAAGALPVDISQTDVYYFSPQKAFGADGGLWVAILSPEAIDRAAGVESSAHLEGAHRWVPPFLSLTTALNNSRKDQTLNTPAVATLIMMETRFAGSTTTAASPGPPHVAPSPHPPCTRGPSAPNTPLRSSSMRTHARTPWSPLIWTNESRPLRYCPSCARTALWTPPATASWAATSCALACSPRWNRLMSWPSPSASTTWSSTCDGIYAMHIDRSQLMPIE